MLHLKSPTSDRWLAQVEANIDEVLIDHAHCEKKAAGTAMNLMFAYIEHEALCRAMTEIVGEELEHFHLVCDLLKERGVRFRRLSPSGFGRKLNDLVRKEEPGRAVDRLLVAGMIEARSCERFGLLRDRLSDRRLAAFFGDLFESEARHHAIYVRLAESFADKPTVARRLDELADAEAEIIAAGEEKPRMHS